MVRLRDRIVRPARAVILALASLALCPNLADAQFFGYGNYAFNYPWFGYGYGFPGYGYSHGYGVPGYGLGYGYGYPGLNYSYGYGFPGWGGYYGASLSVPGVGFRGYSPYGFLGYGATYPNPLFGLGLSPLGVNSALGERYLLGRGLPATGATYRTVSPYGYNSSYYVPGAHPR